MNELGELRGTIHGVIHPRGPWITRGRHPWTRQVRFWLIAWRLDQEPVQTRQLMVAHEVLLGTARHWRRRVADGAAISFVSGGTETSPHGATLVRLGRFLGPANDAELLDVTAPMLRPYTLETAEFGTLVSEMGGGEYTGTCAWHGQPVELTLTCDGPADAQAVLALARTLHAAWDDWEGRLRALVTRELLPLWKDWNPDEPQIDGDTLFNLLTLERIWVMHDGGVQLSVNAGGQFTDHELSVDGTVAGGPASIDLEG